MDLRVVLVSQRIASSAAIVAVLSVVAPRLASGHVAPSLDDNNRYIKISPLGDRVRVAYTAFFGEIPGAVERRAMDANHDGQLDDRERREFGAQLAARVVAGLELRIDGALAAVQWDIVDVGLGTPEVAAGAFSVDLVAQLCVSTVEQHRVVMRDSFALPHPGETEVIVEDSPGIRIDRARVGGADDPSHDYRFTGAARELADHGLDLQFSVTTPWRANGRCAALAKSSPTVSRTAGRAIGAIAGVAALITIGLVVVRRRRS